MNTQKDENGNYYSPIAVTSYVNTLKYSAAKLTLQKIDITDLFSCSSLDYFDEIRTQLVNAPNYTLVDTQCYGEITAALTLYRRFLEEVTKPACWIFQCGTNTYDVVGAVQELDSLIWRISMNEKQIKITDRVYLWIPGGDGGIVASGTIMCNPEQKDPLKNDPYVIDEGLLYDGFTGVDIRIDRRFTNPIVSRSVLLADEQTSKLEILMFPGAENYYIAPEQEIEIENVIAERQVQPAETAVIPGFTGTEKSTRPAAASVRRYWVYTPRECARLWDEFYKKGIIGLDWDALGDLKIYPSKEAVKQTMKARYGPERQYKNAGNTVWQFANELHAGDILYIRSSRSKIVGRGIVKSGYCLDESRSEYRNIRSVTWTHKGEWAIETPIPLKSLANITSFTGYCRKLDEIVAGSMNPETDDDAPASNYAAYTREDFLQDVFMDGNTYDSLRSILMKKKNIILEGAPGVGKTYLAERLAFSVMGEKDTSRVKIVQFHSSYKYEDFIMGYRQTEEGMSLTTGTFYDFCKEAEPDDSEYFFIIDDINRGNIGEIFGDLLMLIENNKRGNALRLLYRNEQFSVPENVYIIGMMNTASHAPSMNDYSLRRRFSFFELPPAFASEGFQAYQARIGNKKFDSLVQAVMEINQAITADASLGNGFLIGHSYFCSTDPIDDEWLNELTEHELIPLIREYWSGDPAKCKKWSAKLSGAVNAEAAAKPVRRTVPAVES